MPIPANDLKRTLTGKFGFEIVPGKSHEAYALIIDGRKVATTRFSRASRDIGDSILNQMAKQVWVTLGNFKKMHGCTMGREEYIQHLRDTNHLS